MSFLGLFLEGFQKMTEKSPFIKQDLFSLSSNGGDLLSPSAYLCLDEKALTVRSSFTAPPIVTIENCSLQQVYIDQGYLVVESTSTGFLVVSTCFKFKPVSGEKIDLKDWEAAIAQVFPIINLKRAKG
mmetsp:Transcript_40288/g.56004  ORF Transcript_40288/g.56004 Transcript_40288/m.56004 type:complete len:128 (+) Transcript_40288:26-409(+)